MAQLSDDCFDEGGRLITTAEALGILADRIIPVAETESVGLRDAAGRILAEDITAPFHVPPYDNSAVDGYAVYFDDLHGETVTELPVGGRTAAGHPLGRKVERGEAIRIFTGAPMPDGPDTVMMQEDCREAGGIVAIPPGIKRGANRRSAGEDVTQGATILSKGMRLRPQDVGLAASIGRTELELYAPLNVTLFSTGDEVREPGTDLPEGCIFDSNRFSTMAALGQLGCRITDLGILPDDLEAIGKALDVGAAEHDLVVTSGGMSVGEEDHVRDAVEARGSIHFWRLAIKPGRPVALGQIGVDGRTVPFIGLPGNPVAAIVTFLLVARPLILRLGGASQLVPLVYRVRADFAHKKKKDRREFIRARLTTGADGIPVAQKFGGSGAGVLSSLVGADGLVELPEDMTKLESGAMVDFLPFSEVLA